MTPEGRVKHMIKRELAALVEHFGLDPKDAIYMPAAGVYGVNGEPDIRVTLLGKELHIETKARRGRLTAQQSARIEALRRCGALVYVVRGEDEARGFSARVLAEVHAWLGPAADEYLQNPLRAVRHAMRERPCL